MEPNVRIERDVRVCGLPMRSAAPRGMDNATVFADEIFGFHAQQAAEKLFKAWLASLGETYPPSHDLAASLDMLSDGGTDVARFDGLVLQLRFIVAFVVGSRGTGLVSSSPERPLHDERGADGRSEKKSFEQMANFGNCRDQGVHGGETAVAVTGLDLFRLRHAMRRMSAVNFARKAAAAMTRLMWRCQPCQERASQWSRPRSSLAR